MEYNNEGLVGNPVVYEFNIGTPLVIEECVKGFEVFPFKGVGTNVIHSIDFDTLTDVLAWAVDMSHDSFEIQHIKGSLFITKKKETL